MDEMDLGRPSLVGLMPDGDAVYAAAISGTYALQISVVDLDSTQVTASFQYTALSMGSAPPSMRIAPQVRVTQNGLAAIAHPFMYSYQFLNEQGSVEGNMTREFEGLVPPYSTEFRGARVVRYFSNLAAPLPLSDGYWLGQASWPTNLQSGKSFFDALESGNPLELEYESSLDVFDQSWELVYSADRETRRSLFEGMGIIGTDGQGHVFEYQQDGTIHKILVEIVR